MKETTLLLHMCHLTLIMYAVSGCAFCVLLSLLAVDLLSAPLAHVNCMCDSIV